MDGAIAGALGRSGAGVDSLEITGWSALGAVNQLTTSALVAAVSSAQALVREAFGAPADARVDRGLLDHWCKKSVEPIGWTLPPTFDAFARDYRAADGVVRLHTNMAHHRARARAVLGDPTTPDEAGEAIASWRAEPLERAIVAAGGCCAQWRPPEAWRAHEQGVAVAREPVIAWREGAAAAPFFRPHDRRRPLAGLRVLDLTRVIAGPVATRFLSSLGAEVLRIDPPRWDESGAEVDLTVGKSCAGLDLAETADRVRLEGLIEGADMLVHGYRADALPRLGLDRERLWRLNPALLCIGLNAYGATGPWRDRRGFDSLVQRSSGVARILASGAARALPYQALDHATGYLAAATALEALLRQQEGAPTHAAHLSLARQAILLLDHSDAAEIWPDFEAPPLEPDRATIEQTAWGLARRLPLPYAIDGVDLGWRTPARRLRSAQPHWTARAR